MTPTLQILWRNLSVYRLPFDLAAAQAMMATATLDDLWELARRSLLQEQQVEGDVQTQAERWRFEFLPLVQRFARQQVEDQSEAHRRAITFYLTLRRRESLHTLETFSAYLEIIHHNCQLKQYSTVLKSLQLTPEFSELLGYGQKRLELHELLVEGLQTSNHEQQLLGVALNDLGNAHCALEHYEQAADCYQRALEVMRQVSDAKGEAYTLGNLGTAHHAVGKVRQAIVFYLKSLKVARSVNDRYGEANALGNIGNAECALGAFQAAITLLEQALSTYEQIKDQRGKANSFGSLGIAYCALDQSQKAIKLFEQQLEISREIGDLQGEANASFNLGLVQEKIGQTTIAMQSLQCVRNLFNLMGLEEKVQNCDQVIRQFSTRRYTWLGRLVDWSLRAFR